MIALGLAVAAAVGYGISSLLQAMAAREAGALAGTLRSPAYLAGLGLDGVAWVASLAAVRGLPLYAVQAVLAGSVAVTAVAARVVLKARLRRVDVAALVVTVVALAVLGAGAGAERPAALSLPIRLTIAAAAALLAAVGWAAGRRASGRRAASAFTMTAAQGPAAVCAALAGVAFGGTALTARALPLSLDAPADPLLWALICFGVTGTLLFAAALQHGDPARVTALLWITEVLVPAALGVALLGDTVRPGWGPAALAAVLASTAAAVVLVTPQPEIARR